MKNIKGRNWGFVIYPDSLPSNWEEIITQIGLPMCISPLHNEDIDPTGEPKKAHYHVIVCYDNTTTYKNVVDNVTSKLNGTIPIKLESIKGMYRYHLHLDNPEKFQYDDRERKFFNGFDNTKINELTKTEVIKIMRELHDFINKNNIIEYYDLLDILLLNEEIELYDVASSHTIFFNTLICSKRNKQLKK